MPSARTVFEVLVLLPPAAHCPAAAAAFDAIGGLADQIAAVRALDPPLRDPTRFARFDLLLPRSLLLFGLPGTSKTMIARDDEIDALYWLERQRRSSFASIAAFQHTVNKGLRMVFGVRPSTAAGSLLVESGIGSLAAISLAATMRLFNRTCEKRTSIKLICHNPQNHNPCRTCKWCLSRRVRQQRCNEHAVGRPDQPVSSRDDLHKFVLARTLTTSSRNDSTDRYAAGFIHTASFVHDPMFDQPRSRGVRLVAALRMNGLWTARSALRIAGLLVNHPFAADRCILCNHSIDNVHPLAYLVDVCVSLRAARRHAGLNPLIDRAKEQDPRPTTTPFSLGSSAKRHSGRPG
ncbi:hypothetical protein HK105_205335 [Polyrhizophydium stewartii]|uniref:Uncharacterized protein n=1 Tax=Polyrhizophydium stewartii TaxID=2732419 RepID=A0ABR4N6Q1_9FUNG